MPGILALHSLSWQGSWRPPNDDGVWLEGGLLIFDNLVEFEFYEKNLGKVKEKQKMWFFAWIALSWKSASHTNGFKCEKLQEAWFWNIFVVDFWTVNLIKLCEYGMNYQAFLLISKYISPLCIWKKISKQQKLATTLLSFILKSHNLFWAGIHRTAESVS